MIPDSYVESITERLSLYSRLDNCETEEELSNFHGELNDRFGPVPAEVEDLFTTVRVRKLSVELGFEKLFLKNETLKCFFVSNPDSPYFQSNTFNGILQFLQTGTNKGKLKQVAGKVKEKAGDALEDGKLHRRAKAKQVKGQVKEATGKTKDTIRDKEDD